MLSIFLWYSFIMVASFLAVVARLKASNTMRAATLVVIITVFATCIHNFNHLNNLTNLFISLLAFWGFGLLFYLLLKQRLPL